jgi:hypothetical protein
VEEVVHIIITTGTLHIIMILIDIRTMVLVNHLLLLSSWPIRANRM